MKSYAFIFGAFSLLAVIFAGCKSGPDIDVLRSEILELHKKTIEAHWEKDVDFFVRNVSDDYFFVSYGEIKKPKRLEIRVNFRKYLNSTTFSEYRDLMDPMIRISEDGSMAWSIVQVKVAGDRDLDDGNKLKLDNTFAWITLYERVDDTWIRLGEVSTNN